MAAFLQGHTWLLRTPRNHAGVVGLCTTAVWRDGLLVRDLPVPTSRRIGAVEKSQWIVLEGASTMEGPTSLVR